MKALTRFELDLTPQEEVVMELDPVALLKVIENALLNQGLHAELGNSHPQLIDGLMTRLATALTVSCGGEVVKSAQSHIEGKRTVCIAWREDVVGSGMPFNASGASQSFAFDEVPQRFIIEL